jgi:integrase
MTLLVLPYLQWPETDRLAWQAAVRDGDVLDGRGPAAHWRSRTRHTNIQHYGRWLSFLARHDALTHDCMPGSRIAPEAIRSYVTELSARVAPRTVVSSLVGLKVMIKAMASEDSWRWLADLCNRLNRTAKPAKDKRPKMRSTPEIVEAAIKELDRLKATSLTRRIERTAYRDHLMIALMALRPLRLRNFATLTLGETLIRSGHGWRIDVPGDETKNGNPLAFEVPNVITLYLEDYLARVRPAFLIKTKDSDTNALWLTYQGQTLTYHTIYCRFILRTEKLFGVPINPHLFRDCAATTLSTSSVDDALGAAALLGHRSFATTERHYIRANQLEASRQISQFVGTIRANSKEAP